MNLKNLEIAPQKSDINKIIKQYSLALLLALIGEKALANTENCTQRGLLNPGVNSLNIRDTSLSSQSNLVGYLTRQNIESVIFDWTDIEMVSINNSRQIRGVRVSNGNISGYVSKAMVSKVEGCDFTYVNRSQEFNNYVNVTQRNLELTIRIARLNNNAELTNILETFRDHLYQKGDTQDIAEYLRVILPVFGLNFNGDIARSTDDIFTYIRLKYQNEGNFDINNYLNIQNPIITNENEVELYKSMSQTNFVRIYSLIPNPSNWTIRQIQNIERDMIEEQNRVLYSMRTGIGLDSITQKYGNNNFWNIFLQIGENYYNEAVNALNRDKQYVSSMLDDIKNQQINNFRNTLQNIDGYSNITEEVRNSIENIISELDRQLTQRAEYLSRLYQSENFLIELNIYGNTTTQEAILRDFYSIYSTTLEVNIDRINFLVTIDNQYTQIIETINIEEDVTNYQLRRFGARIFYHQITRVMQGVTHLEENEKNILHSELQEIVDNFVRSGNFSQYIRDFNSRYGTSVSFELKQGDPRDTFFSNNLRILLENYIQIRSGDFFQEYTNIQEEYYNNSNLDIDSIINSNPLLQRAKNSIAITTRRARSYSFLDQDSISNMQSQMTRYLNIGATSDNPERYYYIIWQTLANEYRIPQEFFITNNLNIPRIYDNIATAIRIHEMRNVFSNLSQREYERYKRLYGQQRIFNILGINDNIAEFNINLNEEYDSVILDVYENHIHKDLIDDFFENNVGELMHYIYLHLGIESRGRVWIRSGIADRRGEYAVGPIQQKLQFARQFGGNPLSKKDSIQNIIDHMLYSFYGIPSNIGRGHGEGQLVQFRNHPNRYDIGLATHIAWDTLVRRALEVAIEHNNVENFSDYLPAGIHNERPTFVRRAKNIINHLERVGRYTYYVSDDFQVNISYDNEDFINERIALIEQFR